MFANQRLLLSNFLEFQGPKLRFFFSLLLLLLRNNFSSTSTKDLLVPFLLATIELCSSHFKNTS